MIIKTAYFLFFLFLAIPSFAHKTPKVAINPGHGIVLDEEENEWKWQRAIFHGQREDNITPEFAILLNKLLSNEEFLTFPTRQLDKSAGTGESGREKWQEAAKDYLKSRGDVPDLVWDSTEAVSFLGKDIVSRPILANYVDADLLINIHTNGTLAGDLTGEGDSSGSGTYYCNKEGYAYSEESINLGEIVQKNLIDNIRSRFDANWKSDGLIGRNHGENCFAKVPSIIVEVAFHDKSYPDAEYLKDLHFRQIVAESLRNSIYEYLLLDLDVVMPLEPEIIDASDNIYNHHIQINWTESNAKSYRLYRCDSELVQSCKEIYSGSDTSYSDTKSLNNTYYFYRLKGCTLNQCSTDFSHYDLGYRGESPEFVESYSGSFSIQFFIFLIILGMMHKGFVKYVTKI
ncbi:MAG: N-acetylmuramoyl-L-alanine amidase [bacterium]